MKPAFAYLRVSGLGQVDGFGFDRQEEAIRAYALAHDIEIVRVYREEGVSGKSELDDRPSLQRLIADLLANGTRMVLIEKLDRLARQLIVQETIIQDLTRRGIELLSVSEPDACSDDPTRVLIRQILGAFFEYERKMIVSKLRTARQMKKERDGRCEGRMPYGSKDDEAATFTHMKVLYAQGMMPNQIAIVLNRDGLRTRYGKLWSRSSVAKILARHLSPKRPKAA